MDYIKPCSHSLPYSPTHVHSFLTHSHSFSAHSHSLPLMFSSLLLILNPLPPMCSLFHSFPVHIQILSPNPTHHLPFQPIFGSCVLRAYVLYLPVCLCGYVIHFYALYCLCLYTFRAFVCVNTSGLFVYTACFNNTLVIPVFFNNTLVIPVFFLL